MLLCVRLVTKSQTKDSFLSLHGLSSLRTYVWALCKHNSVAAAVAAAAIAMFAFGFILRVKVKKRCGFWTSSSGSCSYSLIFFSVYVLEICRRHWQSNLFCTIIFFLSLSFFIANWPTIFLAWPKIMTIYKQTPTHKHTSARINITIIITKY